MVKASLVEQLKELSRREKDFFHPFLLSRQDGDVFGKRVLGSEPDQFLVDFGFISQLSQYCVTAQGYVRGKPEPFCTIFMISPAGELTAASRDQHMHPGNPHPSEQENWDPFEDRDPEGIILMFEELTGLVEAAIVRGKQITEQAALRMSADTFFRGQSPGKG